MICTRLPFDYLDENLQQKIINILNFLNPLCSSSETIDFWAFFGGRIRDAVAGIETPNDADWDILALPRTAQAIVVNAPTTSVEIHEATLSSSIVNNYEEIWGKVWPPLDFLYRGQKIQILRPLYEVENSTERTPLGDLLQPAIYVDILSCGLVLMPNGDLIETLPGAFADARNKYVRKTNNFKVNYQNFEARRNKLLLRGYRDAPI